MKRFRFPALRMFLATALAVGAPVAVVRIGASAAADRPSGAQAAAARLDRLVRNNPGAQQLAPNAVRLTDGAIVSFPMAGVADDKCPYEDLCLFENADFGGERLRLNHCTTYDLTHYYLSDGRSWRTQVSSFINHLQAGRWAYLWHKGGALPAETGYANWELLYSSRARAAAEPPHQMASLPFNDRVEAVRPAHPATASCD